MCENTPEMRRDCSGEAECVKIQTKCEGRRESTQRTEVGEFIFLKAVRTALDAIFRNILQQLSREAEGIKDSKEMGRECSAKTEVGVCFVRTQYEQRWM